MRLTLRTLLAYMDDILDPADHEELGKKIEASDFAAELIHRSRDTVRRLRLGAPEVFAGEDDDVLNPDPASDANTVAEYLDNTLEPERVADFERVCLETGAAADMHLAEVTSCHHVLTMVLGEPAEIDPKVRRRMYELPDRIQDGEKLRIETAHSPVTVMPPSAEAAPVVAAPPQSVGVTPISTAETAALPDYLRVAADRRRRMQRWATAAALLILGGLTAYIIFGEFEEAKVPAEVAAAVNAEDPTFGDVQIGESNTADLPSEGSENNREGTAPPYEDAAPSGQSDVPDGAEVADPSVEQPLNEEIAGVEELSLTAPPIVSTPADDQVDYSDTATDTTSQPRAEMAEAEGVIPSGSSPPPDLAIGNVVPQDMPVESAVPEVSPSAQQDDDSADPNTQIEPETVATLGNDPLGIEQTEAIDETDVVPPEPPGPQQVGVYMGNNDVLLRYVPESGQWVRMPPRTTVVAGDTLLALPKFRTHVVLRAVNSYLSGGTQIAVPEQDETDDSRLALEVKYGRLLLNAGLRGSDLTLKIGGHSREFHLDNSASLAIDVHRIFVPGSDFQTQAAPVEVNWYLTGGSLHRIGPDGTRESVKAPAAWKSLNEADEPVEVVAQMPGWIDREPMTDLERRARDRFAEELPIGQPVSLRLEELNSEDGAGREIRTLSAESSLYVGEFEPFVKALNDSDQRVAWRSHIAAMRQALAMDAHVAAKLREAFINLRGEQDGELLFAMVKGFTPEQIGMTREELQRGVVIDLVRALEHESLDFRVLAIYNLDEIKGTRELAGYRPDGIPRTRNIAVTKIRQMIENNEFLGRP